MDWWPFAVSAVCAGMLMPLAMHVRSFGHEDHGVQRLHDVPTSRSIAYTVFYMTRYRDLVSFRCNCPRRPGDAVDGPDGFKRPHVC